VWRPRFARRYTCDMATTTAAAISNSALDASAHPAEPATDLLQRSAAFNLSALR
jgi:hypothetical protein